jgi:hypothetical protein
MIEIGRDSIVVRGVGDDSPALRKAKYEFSVYDPVAHRYAMSAFAILDGDAYFPASITLPSIKACFPNEEEIINYRTTARSAAIRMGMRNPPRSEIQEKSIRFLIGMRNDSQFRQRFLSLPTGTGKTYITINFVSKMAKRAMIIVDTLSLADQWKNEFLRHSDLREEDIRILSGRDSVDSESKSSDGSVYIALHQTLEAMISEDADSINKLMNKLRIGIRVFDEAHTNFRNVCMINALSNVEYTVYLTATPGRSAFMDDRLYDKVFGRIPYFDGVDRSIGNYHTIVMCSFDSAPPLDMQLTVSTKYGFNAPRWADWISKEGYPSFETSLFRVLDSMRLPDSGRKFAIMLPTIRLIDMVKESLSKRYPKLEIGLFIGSVKSEEKRSEEISKQAFLTNDKMFGKAIDIQDLDALINCVPFGSRIKTEQMIGRLRYREGKPSVMIDLSDTGFRECVRLMKARRKVYRKKAKAIFEIN